MYAVASFLRFERHSAHPKLSRHKLFQPMNLYVVWVVYEKCHKINTCFFTMDKHANARCKLDNRVCVCHQGVVKELPGVITQVIRRHIKKLLHFLLNSVTGVRQMVTHR